MTRVRPAVLGLLLAAALAPSAELPVSEQINAAVARFETAMAREVKPIQVNLDRWRATRLKATLKELYDLQAKAEPADKAYIAYHVLSANPLHKPSRAVFTSAGLAAPFSEKGDAAPGWTMPASRNRALVDKVSTLGFPPFEVVREAIDPKSPTVSSFWRKQKDARVRLKGELVELAKGGPEPAAVVYPMLAYYHPEAPEVKQHYAAAGKPVPRQRVWFNPVDRYLLDHELAGIDCLSYKPDNGAPPSIPGKDQPGVFQGDAAWRFPEYLRNCRVEAVAVIPANGVASFVIGDDRQQGAGLELGRSTLRLHHHHGKQDQLAEITLDPPLDGAPAGIQFEIRGRRLTVAIGGAQVASAELPADYAYKQVNVRGNGLAAQQLRLRYLSDLPPSLLDDALASTEKPLPPPEEPWQAERRAQLEKPVSFAFSDTAMEDVIEILARISGVPFALDAKAEILKDTPVSLVGNDMKLQTALEWLQRVTDLQWQPTAEGFSFTWTR